MITQFDINTAVTFTDKRPGKTIVHDAGALKVQTITLRAGQKIPPCAMEHDVLFYVIGGTGELIADEKKFALKSGTGVVVPKEIKSREMHAHEDLTVLAVQGVPERE